MNDFWSRALGTPQAPQKPAGAWWRAEDPYQRAQELAPGYQPVPSGYPRQDEQGVKAMRKKGHQELTWEDAEVIAQHDLATKAKYQNSCPECGSGNFLTAGMRVANVTMPTDKCFDCGHSARGPEPAIGGRGGGGLATRQIDTGGGGSPNMFMVFRGVPQGYAPRGT